MLRGDTLDASAFQTAAERFLDPHRWRSFTVHASQNGRSTKFVATGKARMPQKFGCGFLHDNDQKVGITLMTMCLFLRVFFLMDFIGYAI